MRKQRISSSAAKDLIRCFRKRSNGASLRKSVVLNQTDRWSILFRDKSIRHLINQNIPIIFFFAEPEIEIWFYYDATNVFNNNVPLIRELNTLYKEYKYSGWQYDSSKDACLKKFSELFLEVLNHHKIPYSKKQEGSNYLRKTSPELIAKHDNEIRKAIEVLKAVKNVY